MMNPINIGVLF